MAHRIQTIVFDWAGTMVDFGCRAPVRALQEVLRRHGVAASEAEVRADMGKAKHAHIAALLAMPGLAAQWRARHGRAASGADIDRLHDEVGPLMIAAAAECAALIPGALETVRWARARGIKIGSNTGYTRAMMEAIVPIAAAQGYVPDMIVCSGETAEGRPAPLMLWKIMAELGIWPANACVKVDDAPVGIAEARNAGTWAVGVAASGNGVGLDAAALAALPPAERGSRIGEARAALLDAGAHMVIDSVADLPAAIAEIEAGVVIA
ncbi:phosphonoacetaldehyde hydrolase [Novosphingobium sp. Chol11]|uniref:phosphonoacetaldehyde hydrolase n=1 Tax=Novosphingobium sp. Chol11 TaxID=1385763 RepID=UPI0025F084B7|nr:phosphonoacetaldehyde hydrolase [Novosphingobium sp. Chol11]